MNSLWTYARNHKRRTVIAGTLVAVFVIAACSAGSQSSKTASAGTQVRSAAGGATTAPYGSALGKYAPAAASPNLDAVHATAGTATSAKAPSSPTDQLLTDDRALIRTAQITVQEKKAADVATAADKAEALVNALGGQVYADNRSTGSAAEASLNLRVPPADLDQVLTSLGNLGVEQSRTVSTQDVTTQVADVGARLKSAQDSINRLRILFSSATKIGDIISLEDELSNREATLESLEAQQKALGAETSMANVTLTITTAPPPIVKAKTVVHHKRNAFVKSLSSGWHHFTGAAAWLVGVLATLLPFLVLIVVALSLWTALGRLRQQRRTGTDRSPATS